jgi:hypothetical protein
VDTVEYTRQLIAFAHNLVDDSMSGLTVEQFNWAPPGTANTISAIFIHLLTSEDFFVQEIMQGKSKLWETGGWAKKTGVKAIPDFGTNWDDFKHTSLALEPALAFQQAVWAATGAYRDSLSPKELEREVKFGGGDRSVAGIFVHTSGHTLFHAGEIAILKGVQGGKGLPF